MSQEFSRRAFVGLGLTGAAGIALTACAPGSAPAPGGAVAKEAVTIKYWTHDSLLSQPLLEQWASVMSADPTVPFTYKIETTIVAPPDLTTKLRAAYLANDNPPDIVNVIGDYFPNIMDVASDVFVDLTSEVDKVRQFCVPNLWEPYSVDQKNYGLELSPAMMTLYFRPDEWEKIGMRTDIETWEEFLAEGKQRAVPAGKYLGSLGNGSPREAANSWLPFLLQRGGKIFNEDGTSALDSAEARAALEFWVELADSKVFIMGDSAIGTGPLTAMANEDLIGLPGPDWFNRFIMAPTVPEQSGTWRIGPLPRFEAGGTRNTISGGSAWLASKNSSSADAAVEMLRRALLTEQGQIAGFAALANIKPSWLTAYEAPAILNATDAFLGDQKIGPVYAEMIGDIPVMSYTPYTDASFELMNKAVLDALSGRPAVDALADASRGIDALAANA